MRKLEHNHHHVVLLAIITPFYKRAKVVLLDPDLLFLPSGLGVSILSFFLSFWSSGRPIFKSLRQQFIELSY